jgi:hypothetical protein
VPVDGPDSIFRPGGARRAVEAYLRVCGDPRSASADDVLTVFRNPSRGLALGGQDHVAASLRAGASFVDAVAELGVGVDAQRRLRDGAEILAGAAAICDDANAMIVLLRRAALQRHFQRYDDAAGTEAVEVATLDACEREAVGRTGVEYADVLAQQAGELARIHDPTNGIELATVHGAKGRQWPEVIVFGVDDDVMPHRRLDETGSLEEERRIAYVAFTRAQARLRLVVTSGTPSRFLAEARLVRGSAAPDLARRKREVRSASGSRRSGSHRRETPPRPRVDPVESVRQHALALVGQNPGRLTPGTIAAALRGVRSHAVVRRMRLGDQPGFGACASLSEARIKEAVRTLVAQGALRSDETGHLVVTPG